MHTITSSPAIRASLAVLAVVAGLVGWPRTGAPVTESSVAGSSPPGSISGDSFGLEPSPLVDPSRSDPITVPEGRGARVLLDGWIEPGEWDEARVLPLGRSASLLAKAYGEAIYLAVRTGAGTPRPVDLFLAGEDGRVLQIHGSMATGQKLLREDGCQDPAEPWVWSRHPGWAGSLAHLDRSRPADLPLAERLLPAEAVEFKVLRSLVAGGRWRVRVEIGDFAGTGWADRLPEGADCRDPSTWPALVLPGVADAGDASASAGAVSSPGSGDPAPPADPEDVASPDAILAALYDVISGPVGQERDWERFRSLFVPGARLIPTGRAPDGRVVHQVWTVEDYVSNAGPGLVTVGFREREIARTTEAFGNVLHAFSTYEAFRGDETEPFVRGINSIQLLDAGDRWWIVTVFWSSETEEHPIPGRYLGAEGGG